MRPFARPLALAAAFHACLAAAAAAQTVIATHVPPGGKVDVVLNGKPAGSAAADASGVATLRFDLHDATGAMEMDARVYVDVCPQRHGIVIVERNQIASMKEEGCDRREIPGIFWVRQVSTLVVNVAGPIPTLLLTKGKYDVRNPSPPKRSPRGLVIFGGGGLSKIDEFVGSSCGTVTSCSGKGSGGAFTVGAAYWITPWLAAEGSYIRPSRRTASGNGDDFDFETTLDPHFVTAVGTVGIPIGPVRLYGQAGANFHRATTKTSQTSGSDTQTFELQTEGWGMLFGGGLEAWIKPAFAIYFNAAVGSMKGEATAHNVEGEVDQGFKYLMLGARVRLF